MTVVEKEVTFNDLSKDVSEIIINQLDAIDAIRLSGVCRLWNRYVKRHNVYWFLQFSKSKYGQKAYRIHHYHALFEDLGKIGGKTVHIVSLQCYGEKRDDILNLKDATPEDVHNWRIEADELTSCYENKGTEDKCIPYRWVDHKYRSKSNLTKEEFYKAYIMQKYIDHNKLDPICKFDSHMFYPDSDTLLKKYNRKFNYHRAYIISMWRLWSQKTKRQARTLEETLKNKKKKLSEMKKKITRAKTRIRLMESVVEIQTKSIDALNKRIVDAKNKGGDTEFHKQRILTTKDRIY
jgi:hypothetical protein